MSDRWTEPDRPDEETPRHTMPPERSRAAPIAISVGAVVVFALVVWLALRSEPTSTTTSTPTMPTQQGTEPLTTIKEPTPATPESVPAQ